MVLGFQSSQKLVARPLSSPYRDLFQDCSLTSLCLPACPKMAEFDRAASQGSQEAPLHLGRLALQDAPGQCTQLVFLISLEMSTQEREIKN